MPAVFADVTERDYISGYRDLAGHDTVR